MVGTGRDLSVLWGWDLNQGTGRDLPEGSGHMGDLRNWEDFGLFYMYFGDVFCVLSM